MDLDGIDGIYILTQPYTTKTSSVCQAETIIRSPDGSPIDGREALANPGYPHDHLQRLSARLVGHEPENRK